MSSAACKTPSSQKPTIAVKNFPIFRGGGGAGSYSNRVSFSSIRSVPMRASCGNGGIAKNSHVVREDDGVIIVDHGSRRRESNLMLEEFVATFRSETRYLIVEPAHMPLNTANLYKWASCCCLRAEIVSDLELALPSIQDAYGLCVQQGAKRVIVSPFFLFPGRHWHQDIPSLTAEAAKEHPGVSYIITAPLGLHTLLVDVVNDRIKHCLSHIAGDATECAVCVGSGKCKLYNTM